MVWDVEEITKLTAQEKKNNGLLRRSRSQNQKLNHQELLKTPPKASNINQFNQMRLSKQHQETNGSDNLRIDLGGEIVGENGPLENTPSSFRFKMQRMNNNGAAAIQGGPIMSPQGDDAAQQQCSDQGSSDEDDDDNDDSGDGDDDND